VLFGRLRHLLQRRRQLLLFVRRKASPAAVLRGQYARRYREVMPLAKNRAAKVKGVGALGGRFGESSVGEGDFGFIHEDAAAFDVLRLSLVELLAIGRLENGLDEGGLAGGLVQLVVVELRAGPSRLTHYRRCGKGDANQSRDRKGATHPGNVLRRSITLCCHRPSRQPRKGTLHARCKGSSLRHAWSPDV